RVLSYSHRRFERSPSARSLEGCFFLVPCPRRAEKCQVFGASNGESRIWRGPLRAWVVRFFSKARFAEPMRGGRGRFPRLRQKGLLRTPRKLKPWRCSVRPGVTSVLGLPSVVPDCRLRSHRAGHRHVLRSVLRATPGPTAYGEPRLRSGDVRRRQRLVHRSERVPRTLPVLWIPDFARRQRLRGWVGRLGAEQLGRANDNRAEPVPDRVVGFERRRSG